MIKEKKKLKIKPDLLLARRVESNWTLGTLRQSICCNLMIVVVSIIHLIYFLFLFYIERS